MLKVTGHQEGGWTVQVPDTTVAGKWRWSLLGPAPQTIEKDDGGDVDFMVDESDAANLGEYTLSVQRLDAGGGFIGDSQSSASFQISGPTPPTMIDVEVAGPVSVTITAV